MEINALAECFEDQFQIEWLDGEAEDAFGIQGIEIFSSSTV